MKTLYASRALRVAVSALALFLVAAGYLLIGPHPTDVRSAQGGSEPEAVPDDGSEVFLPLVAAGSSVTGSGLLQISSGGHFVLDGRPFVMKGFNPRNYPWCAIDTWNWQEVGEELALGASLGANTVRTFVDYSFCTNNPHEINVDVNYHPTAACLQAFGQFLQLADQRGLKVIVFPLQRMPGWAIVDNGQHWIAEAYLDELVAPFADDPRIAAWDVLNEGDLFPTPMEKVVAYERAIADHLHSIDPNHLVTAHRARADSTPETQEYVDYVTFHNYERLEGVRQRIQAVRSQLLRPMPVVLGEYGYSSAEPSSSYPLSGHLVWLGGPSDAALQMENLDGALFWELMDHNSPPTSLTSLCDTGQDLSEKFGVFESDLTPKLSASIMRKYFTGKYGPSNRLLLQYSEVVLEGGSEGRYLALAMRYLDFLDGDGGLIQHIPFGTTDANLMQGHGWQSNEDWGQWTGDPAGSAALYVTIPTGAVSLRLNMASQVDGNQVQVSYAGRLLGSAMVGQQPGEFTFGL
jgi:hypothetical protein